MQPVCLLMIISLFTLLYLIIWLNINLLILLKEPSREKALHTLHVMTEKHFLLRKKTKQEGQVALKHSPEFCLKLTYRYL